MLQNYRILQIALFLCGISCIIIPVTAIYTVSDLSGPPIIQGHQFTVDLTGKPLTSYYIWLTGTWSLSGNAYDQPPFIVPNQLNVQQDPDDGPYTIGLYKYTNGGGRTILNDVAPTSSLMSNTSYYALVTTDESGLAVVAFGTSVNTALQSYSIRAENPTSLNNNTLLITRGDVTVNSGSVSITGVPTPIVSFNTPTMIPTTIPTQSPTIPSTTITPNATQSTMIPTTTPTVPLEPVVAIIAFVFCAIRFK